MMRQFGIALAMNLSIGGMLIDQAAAHQVTVRDLVISHPWTRATPPGAKTAAGYVTIINKGSSADTLIGASADFAALSELHEDSVSADGVMQMRPLTEGIVIEAGATIKLAPGGKHLMFTGLKQGLKQDLYFDGSLTFAKAGQVKVEFFVEPIGAKEAQPH